MTLTLIQANLIVCHRCKSHRPLGVCAEDAVGIVPHASAGDCPKGLHVAVDGQVVPNTATWGELHQWSIDADLATAEAWIGEYNRRVCGYCRADWVEWIDAHSIDTRSRASLFAWTVEAHNAVNRRLGKVEVSIEQAERVWISGAAKS